MPTAARRSAANKSTAAKAKAEEAAAPDEKPKNETESQKRNRLRNEAERKVINNHREEFNQVATELFAENGLVFHRRLTDEERAAKEIADKLNQFPELRALFAPVGAMHTAQQEAQQQQGEPLVPAAPGGALQAFRDADVDGLSEAEAHLDFPGEVPAEVQAHYSGVERDPFFDGGAPEERQYMDLNDGA
jgi:hypothetical protein